MVPVEAEIRGQLPRFLGSAGDLSGVVTSGSARDGALPDWAFSTSNSGANFKPSRGFHPLSLVGSSQK